MASKFKIGDKVKIVNYGHLIWQNKTNQDAERKFHEESSSFITYTIL